MKGESSFQEINRKGQKHEESFDLFAKSKRDDLQAVFDKEEKVGKYIMKIISEIFKNWKKQHSKMF